MIRRPATILALLTGLNLLNYLDRLVVSAVLPSLQAELGVSNFVGGLLATVFLLGYFATSPIFGAMGDRKTRKGLIAFGVAVWSAATLASGLAVGQTSLLLARTAVGVGEASYATLAPTIIDDIAPPDRKGRWLAYFYVAGPLGGALGYLVGGFVEHRWGWRHAFFVAGGPGLLLALLCLLIAEPKRKVQTHASMTRDIGTLRKLPLYRQAILGYCAYTAAVGAFSYWAPKFLVARYAAQNLTLEKANFNFGLVTVGGGLLGTLLGGWWADRKPTDPTDPTATVNRLLKICAVGSIVGTPLAAFGFLLAPTPNVFFAAIFGCEVALFLCTSPINAIVLSSVPVELRASAMALCIFSIHIFGDLWSPPLVGLLADYLPIGIAMGALPIAIAASALFWWPRAART